MTVMMNSSFILIIVKFSLMKYFNVEKKKMNHVCLVKFLIWEFLNSFAVAIILRKKYIQSYSVQRSGPEMFFCFFLFSTLLYCNRFSFIEMTSRCHFRNGKFANDTKLIVVTDARERRDVIQIDLDKLKR